MTDTPEDKSPETPVGKDVKEDLTEALAAEMPVISEEESLIEYPCDFPIKALGRQDPELAQELCERIQAYAPEFDPTIVSMRMSSKGNYVGLTFTVHVTSRKQLDDIYRTLHAHPLVTQVF